MTVPTATQHRGTIEVSTAARYDVRTPARATGAGLPTSQPDLLDAFMRGVPGREQLRTPTMRRARCFQAHRLACISASQQTARARALAVAGPRVGDGAEARTPGAGSRHAFRTRWKKVLAPSSQARKSM